MMVELAISAITTIGFAVIAAFEYLVDYSKGESPESNMRSNRLVYILLGLSVIIGNISIWTPAIFGW
jgi:hypothetical protein